MNSCLEGHPAVGAVQDKGLADRSGKTTSRTDRHMTDRLSDGQAGQQLGTAGS
jgi:hypothetical protein